MKNEVDMKVVELFKGFLTVGSGTLRSGLVSSQKAKYSTKRDTFGG